MPKHCLRCISTENTVAKWTIVDTARNKQCNAMNIERLLILYVTIRLIADT